MRLAKKKGVADFWVDYAEWPAEHEGRGMAAGRRINALVCIRFRVFLCELQVGGRPHVPSRLGHGNN
jgi:hypothetical protein